MQQNNNLSTVNGGKRKNTLLPVTTEIQANSFYRYSVMEVEVDTSPTSGDIFKVGRAQVGGDWVDTYSLAKPLLMKLSTAAGIQFDPTNTGGEYIGKNCYKARAFGAMLLPDGTPKTHYDEKVINLDDEEDNLRLEFMTKALEGITDKKQAEEASRLFTGNWQNTTNKWGKKCDAYFVSPQDREAYIDRGVLINMILLRKTMAEKAMTGATLRVIRALTGVKSGYTKQELSVPFSIPRVAFVPNLEDPTVKLAMIERGLNAATSLFGSANTPRIVEQNPKPEGTLDISELLGCETVTYEHTSDGTEATQRNQGQSTEETADGVCVHCGATVAPEDKDYTTKAFGHCICVTCFNGREEYK